MASRFVSTVRKDSRYKNFRKNVKNGMYSIEYTKYMDEIKQMHATRKVRFLKPSQVVSKHQEKLISAYNQNQRYRSRCAEIKMEVNQKMSILDRHLTGLKRYLLSKYQKQLREDGFTTREQQNAAIENLLERPLDLYNELESVDKVLDIVVADMDKAYWSLESMLKTLQLSTVRERNI